VINWNALAIPKGTPRRKEKAKKARALIGVKRAQRERILALDGYTCRWPECEVPRDSYWGALEAMHVKAAGMGGDPTLERYTDENLLTGCRWHHRGPRGLHSGFAKMELVSETEGARGWVEFYQMVRGEGGLWTHIGTTRGRETA
jgi:hypothetical protein